MKKYINLLVFLIFLAHTQKANSSSKDSNWEKYVETIERSFDFQTISPDIWVDNIYGNVNIISSERSNAKIEVKITVEAKNQSRANEIFDKIDVDFKDTPTSLRAATRLRGSNQTKKRESFKIDYTVYLPIKTDLSIENKYGDINLSKHSNNVDISLQYGNGSVQDIDGDLAIALAYADRFDAGSASGDVDIKTSYSKLSMEGAKNIDCRTSFSTLSFGSSSNLNLNSQYDNFSINAVDEIDVTAKYSDFAVTRAQKIDFDFDYTSVEIKELSSQGSFDSDYGNVTIKSVSAKASEIDIDSQHTDYSIFCEGNLDVDIDTEHTLVKYPKDLTITLKEKDGQELALQGHRGTGGVAITADMEYGSLIIKN